MSNVISAVASAIVVSYNPPKSGGLCARVWELCHAAKIKGSPITSKSYASIAAAHGLNLSNFKQEAARYNRYVAAHPLYAPGAAPAQKVDPRASVLANMLAAIPAPVVAPPAPVVVAEPAPVVLTKAQRKAMAKAAQ